MTARNWGTSTFIPGDHDALAGPDAVGIVEHGQPSTRSRLWALIANESALDDVLDELSSAGLKALPSFAIAQREDTGVRVVARGAAHVVVTTVDGSEHIIDPTGVRTWTEELFDDVASVVLSMRPDADGAAEFEPGPDRAEHGDHFVLAGAVPASLLRRDFASDHGLAGRARSDWTRPPATSASPNEPPAPPIADVAKPARHGAPSPAAPEPTGASAVPAEAAPIGELADEPVSEPDAHNVSEVAPPLQPTPTPGPPPLPATPAPSQPPNRPRGPFDALDLDTDAPASPPRLISSVPINAVPGMSETAAPPGPSTPPADVEAANEAVASVEPGHHAPAGGTDDVDNLTISRAELAKRRQLDDSGPLPGPGQVRAMLCSAGHPNPPHQTICRTCAGRPIPAGVPVIVERPPLAVLAFSSAERVVVDRSVIIGRNPKVTEASGGELPRIARFDDESTLGLSRSHAQIVVEGWQMFVEDLHSRNGTELTLPGRARQRLRGGEAVMLEVGAVIHLDEDLTCTVEASV